MKKYIAPEINIEEYQTTCVIMASGFASDNFGKPDGDDSIIF